MDTRPTRLYGRARETAEVCAAVLSGPGSTEITGFAGMGKTALAREAAGLLREEHGLPVLWAPAAASADDLCGEAGDRAALIVLDGLDEHGGRAPSVAGLADRCPRAHVLITSRAPLTPPAANRVRLGPLAPAAGADAGYDLLLAAVRRADPSFRPAPADATAIAAVCRLLDGIPRSLEAAAHWFALATPGELLALAREERLLLTAPPWESGRPRWLPRAAARALTSLPLPHARLLAAMARLDRPWTAAEAAAATAGDRFATTRALRGLTARGLVLPATGTFRGPTRFAILESVRAAWQESGFRISGEVLSGLRSTG
ncbi:hypothetical protein AB0D99_14960 [Streptomyces sp. NPDC047971]|uniref:hypothetical protein n=1 Tax=Streptomyces sp. NPDC047971 TaxID=3154499 RepID=UPI0033C9CF12